MISFMFKTFRFAVVVAVLLLVPVAGVSAESWPEPVSQWDEPAALCDSARGLVGHACDDSQVVQIVSGDWICPGGLSQTRIDGIVFHVDDYSSYNAAVIDGVVGPMVRWSAWCVQPEQIVTPNPQAVTGVTYYVDGQACTVSASGMTVCAAIAQAPAVAFTG